MNVYRDGPIHSHPTYRRPTYVNSSVAEPPRLHVTWLRSSCGHILGVGLVGRRQRFIQWAVCR